MFNWEKLCCELINNEKTLLLCGAGAWGALANNRGFEEGEQEGRQDKPGHTILQKQYNSSCLKKISIFVSKIWQRGLVKTVSNTCRFPTVQCPVDGETQSCGRVRWALLSFFLSLKCHAKIYHLCVLQFYLLQIVSFHLHWMLIFESDFF